MPSKNISKEVQAQKYPEGMPSAKTMRPDDLLFQACTNAVSMASLDRALQKKANVNARDHTGTTPLMLASVKYMTKQYIPFITKLLAQKAEVNTETEWGETALDKVLETIRVTEAARETEMKNQVLRREIMEGKGPTGWGYGSVEDQRKTLIPNNPLADELDEFKTLPQLYQAKVLLEQAGAKVGEASYNPAYLTTEEYVEKRDKINAKYSDAKYKMYVNQTAGI
mmetsp:Transcript_42847/g.91298  ORF Transcript_42847/g.91298 Transcript_42847/m.91298 type:complete len:225 (+) Transcript_42847:96-770(+)